MSDSALQLTLREMQTIFTNKRFWIGIIAVIIILTVAGPFGTITKLTFSERLYYWSMTAVSTFFCGLAVSFSVTVWFLNKGFTDWISRVLGGLAAGMPVAVLVWSIDKFLFNMEMGGWFVFFRILSSCTAISVAVSILYLLVSKQTAEKNDQKQSAFLARIPRHLGKNLLHLSANDHYVKVVTDRGAELILMRFSDALLELSHLDGIQIHRAHWISLNAVKKPVRKNGKLLLEMVDNERLPVSRSHLKSVKEALNIK